MTELLVVLAATCALEALETRVEPTPSGWWEESEITVLSQGGCTSVDVGLPPGVHLRATQGRLRLGDDTKRVVPPDRWELLERGADDEGIARVHLPELLGGDRAVLRFTREWSFDAPFRWRPHGAAWASLRSPRGVTVESWGMNAGRTYWATRPAPGAEVRLGGRTPEAAPLPETRIFGLPPIDALLRASRMALLPRGVDGPAPLAGQEALERMAADDRGFARTVVALAHQGPEPVELGWWLPAHGDTAEEGEVAVWWHEGAPTLLSHPDAPPREGQVRTASGTFAAAQVPIAAEPVSAPSAQVQRTLTLRLPPGDPLLSLYPGGGSSVELDEVLTFEELSPARTWVVPLPPERGPIEVKLLPEGTASTWREREDGVVFVIAPARGRVEATIRTTWPDAPTYGRAHPRPGELLDLVVEVPDGRVEWERDGWRLSSWKNLPVTPDRDVLLRGLQYRYDGLSMPEPALPLELKGAPPSWDLVSLLRPTLHDRAVTAPLPQDPLWPRRLSQARRSGVVTPIEAALILRLYAIQSKLAADWALVRPAPQGPGYRHVPVGFDEAVVRVTWEGEQRWIDPSCRVCAPFELRPDLEGAAALGPGIDRTPAPTPGRLALSTDGDRIAWQLEGPPALLLRLWLEDVPAEERLGALARRVAGAGASLVEVTGIGEAGAPIRVVAQGAPQGAPQDVFADLSWVGERTSDVGGPPARLETPALSWERDARGERLVVRERSWGDAPELRAARSAMADEAPTDEVADP